MVELIASVKYEVFKHLGRGQLQNVKCNVFIKSFFQTIEPQETKEINNENKKDKLKINK